ncbi:glutamate--tRNA ligase [Acuticoccus sp. MNP-M23]|uniref:glutamate--tRNA ligase n=1 Tax=Acuticoccus sp. MNP-M23 TaxID=3072793 RepID=UPI0028151C1C|nr:glutamate--tRNA ligase [Acuticoccus sp. MNP-M23]WMS41226.1 glutamate--tRNA ligase [Acuticoccus sp. MNP-M23]
MADTVRFAPSPTGKLHIGNVRTALYNWFEAGKGGRFILRFDDTDTGRSEQRYADQITADMAWLGIMPDLVVRQSDRLGLYDAAADRLRDAGLLYPCFETPEELERKRVRQRARGLPPIYDRAALALGTDEKAALEAEGRRPHWRFKLPDGPRTFADRCRESLTVNLGALSDPVLIREDGSYLYTLTSVVDDADLGVTLVVRGEDHVTNTGVQIALFEALGAPVPAFAHHNLLTRTDGEPLSKRDNPLSIRALAAAGFEPMAVASLGALTGTSHPVAPAADLAALASTVSLGDMSRGPAMFDPAELERLNAAIVHALPVAAIERELAEQGLAGPEAAAFWETVQGNLTFRHELGGWAERLAQAPDTVMAGADPLSAEDRAVVAAAAEALPAEPWDDATFGAWTKAVRAETGAKGKALFMPLRRALTGTASGPELGPWLHLLGRQRALDRLSAALN